jgi:hypothetical protein
MVQSVEPPTGKADCPGQWCFRFAICGKLSRQRYSSRKVVYAFESSRLYEATRRVHRLILRHRQ